jgi:cell wall-associated NlpC family hydrolase
MKKLVYLTILTTLLLAFSVSSALASITAQSTAMFTGAPSITGASLTSGTYKLVSNEIAFSDVSPYVDQNGMNLSSWSTNSSQASAGTAQTTSSFDSTSNVLKSYSTAGPPGIDNPYAGFNSYIIASVNYTYTGVTSDMIVSIPYDLLVHLSMDSYGFWAYGYVQADMEIDVTHKIGSKTSTVPYETSGYLGFPRVDAGSGSGSKTDTLLIDIPSSKVHPGDYGTIYFKLYSEAQGSAPVPIPSALWLLSSGLIGFIGVRRKFSK